LRIIDKAIKVKLLILDVDGVLTDGKIVLDENGKQLKFFDVQDGLGVVLLKRAGINTIILSARYSRTVSFRAKDIKILSRSIEMKLGFSKILRHVTLKM